MARCQVGSAHYGGRSPNCQKNPRRSQSTQLSTGNQIFNAQLRIGQVRAIYIYQSLETFGATPISQIPGWLAPLGGELYGFLCTGAKA